MRALFAVAVSFAVASFAQPTTFDVTDFVVPDGYQVTRKTDQVQLVRIDKARSSFSMLVVYIAVKSSGSPQQDFASEWKATAGTSFHSEGTPPSSAAACAPGVTCIAGGDEVTLDGNEYYAHVYVHELGERVVSLMVVATSREYFSSIQPVIAAFQKTMRFAGAARAAAPVPAPVAPRTATRRGDAKWTGAPIVGVWAGFKDTSDIDFSPTTGFQFVLSKHAPRWRTFLGDGSSFEDMPTSGLLSLDLASARADPNTGAFWGTWSVAGDKVTARQPSGRVQEYHLDGDVLREDAKTTGHTTYWRLKPVDGLKLDGTWSSWQRWSDDQASPNWQSAPVISFTRDGRFVDRGAFMGNPTDPLTPQNAHQHPGKGSYEIQGYTLVLRYDDGREEHRFFSGAMKQDPFKDSSVVFIAKFPFYRR